jgi:hypothetical protein
MPARMVVIVRVEAVREFAALPGPGRALSSTGGENRGRGGVAVRDRVIITFYTESGSTNLNLLKLP